MRANLETHTCSKVCSKKNQASRRRQRRLAQTVQAAREHEPLRVLSQDGSMPETE
jgi:hypothetical protein